MHHVVAPPIRHYRRSARPPIGLSLSFDSQPRSLAAMGRDGERSRFPHPRVIRRAVQRSGITLDHVREITETVLHPQAGRT